MNQNPMQLLWLSCEDELIRELKGFARAFERAGCRLQFLGADDPPDIDLNLLMRRAGGKIDLIVHPEPFRAVLPRGLTEMRIPSVGFQCDVYAYTHRRYFYSMLFDYVAILHPGYEEAFHRAGHPSTITLPFGVEPSSFEDEESDRTLEVASVGRLHPSIYRKRLGVLSALSSQFKMNAWNRFVEFEDVLPVYRSAKIGINIPRDDYTSDANVRVFEVLASGALLITEIPTELRLLGFEEGVHFVGFRETSEVVEIVRRYLADDDARRRIARAGHDKVMREHTYDVRIATLLEKIRGDAGTLRAPARSWRESKVRLAYLDYFAGNGAFDCAADDLWAILKRGSPESGKALRLFGRSKASRVINYLRFRGTSFWPSASKA
jgi:glycosyltransferase involved in cell wall biosynthesis